MTTFQTLSSDLDSYDNDNVNLVPIGEDIFATTETRILHKIDPATLDTKDRVCLLIVIVLGLGDFGMYIVGWGMFGCCIDNFVLLMFKLQLVILI